jgi:hypothetical protein
MTHAIMFGSYPVAICVAAISIAANLTPTACSSIFTENPIYVGCGVPFTR